MWMLCVLMCNSVSQETPDDLRKLPQLPQAHRNMLHTNSKHLLATSGHPSTSGPVTSTLISDNSPSASAQELTGCGPSNTHFHKPISGLFPGKCHIYCNTDVLNHVTCVKLSQYFYKVPIFSSTCQWWNFCLEPIFPVSCVVFVVPLYTVPWLFRSTWQYYSTADTIMSIHDRMSSYRDYQRTDRQPANNRKVFSRLQKGTRYGPLQSTYQLTY